MTLGDRRTQDPKIETHRELEEKREGSPPPSLTRTPTHSLTLTPSILNPRVAVELIVSLHCMYLGLVTAFLSFSSIVGAAGSTSIIF